MNATATVLSILLKSRSTEVSVPTNLVEMSLLPSFTVKALSKSKRYSNFVNVECVQKTICVQKYNLYFHDVRSNNSCQFIAMFIRESGLVKEYVYALSAIRYCKREGVMATSLKLPIILSSVKRNVSIHTNSEMNLSTVFVLLTFLKIFNIFDIFDKLN